MPKTGFLSKRQGEKVGIGIVISDRIAKITCQVIGNYLYIADSAYSFIHKKGEERETGKLDFDHS